MNKIVLFSIVALLFLATSLYLFDTQNEGDLTGYAIALLFARLLALIMMVAHGDFSNTTCYKLARLAISVIILGLIFKILHYPGSVEMILLGSVSVTSLYLIYFIRKDSRPLLSYLKLLVVLFTFLTIPITGYTLLEYDVVNALLLLRDAVTWGTFALFVFSGIKDRTLLA